MFNRIELRDYSIQTAGGIKLAYIAQVERTPSDESEMLSHNITEIMFCYRGKGIFGCGEREIEIGENELFIVNPDTMHCERATSKNFGFYIVGIENYCWRNESENGETYKPSSDAIGYYAKQITLEYERGAKDFKNVATTLFTLIIREVGEAQFVPVYKKYKNADELTGLIKKYVDEHFLEELTISLIAKTFYCNETTLQHNFKKNVGVSLIEYVLQKRLSEAVNWLTISNISVSKVCEKSGFTNVSYFIYYFKKRYGVTPKKYRENLKNK